MEPTSTETVEVPTAETVAAATEVAIDSMSAAQESAAVSQAASAVAIETAATLQTQIEDDEEWLEKRLLEIQAEITSLRTQVTDLPQSLMATLSQQAELIRQMTEQITALSIRVTSLPESQTPVTETPAQSVVVVPEDQRTTPEVQPEKKRRKI